MADQQVILVIEDSPEDFEATTRVLRKSGLANPIFRCSDGDEALDFLFHRGAYSDRDLAPRPSVILLDLNLPGTDGRDVLIEVKNDEQLKLIPVVVLTTSSDERDIAMCYQSGANSYMKKPVDLGGFVSSIQRLKDYWFEIVILPRVGDSPARSLSPEASPTHPWEPSR
jgi:CheY-like chemotaxis protein